MSVVNGIKTFTLAAVNYVVEGAKAAEKFCIQFAHIIQDLSVTVIDGV